MSQLLASDRPVADPAGLTPPAARRLFRAGLRTPTPGWCAGWTQANLIAVPREVAYDLLVFAQRNPQACPVLDVAEPGAVRMALHDGDLRTDLPAYTVYRDGELVDSPGDVRGWWRDDLVAVLIGCSFTFERALTEAGVPIRHLELGVNVPMFRTSVRCRPAGMLSGPLVVSMRPVPAALVATAVRVTGRYPGVHGAPIHVGDPPHWASPGWAPLTSATRWRCGPARCRCSGPAASLLRRWSWRLGRSLPSGTFPATWQSRTPATRRTWCPDGHIRPTAQPGFTACSV